MLSTLNLDVFMCLINMLAFRTLKDVPFICKAVRQLCISIHGGWARYMKARMVLFQDNCKYVCTPTGWIKYIKIYTVRLPPYQLKANVPLTMLAKTVILNGKRRKVHTSDNGVQHFRTGPDDKWPIVYASSDKIDNNSIRVNNDYWATG